MAMTETGGRGTRSTINVTPLIDVLLVLLIIFMVIEPTAQHGLDALVPRKPDTPQAEPDPRTVVISVRGGASGPSYALNEQPVALKDLSSQLERLVQQSGRRAFFISADATLDYAAVVPVLDAAHAAGAAELGILTLSSQQAHG